MAVHDDGAMAAAVTDACSRCGNRPEQLIEILHEVHHRLGHVPTEAVAPIAEALNISRADVHGVVSFYHDFEGEPRARHDLQVCGAEACQSMGCESLVAHAERRVAGSGGRVALRTVYCLGNCALAPAVMIDGTLHGRVDAERLDDLLAEAGR